jgi:glycyl-tRNA synthetase (class II)
VYIAARRELRALILLLHALAVAFSRYRADHLHYSPVVVEGEEGIVGYVCVLEGEEGEKAMAKQAKTQAKRVLKEVGKKGSKILPLELRPFTEATEEEIKLVPSPATGEPGSLTAPRDFDLMFSTAVGAMEGATSTAYLRPETAQVYSCSLNNLDYEDPSPSHPLIHTSHTHTHLTHSYTSHPLIHTSHTYIHELFLSLSLSLSIYLLSRSHIHACQHLQGTFVNFRNVMSSARLKLPFGIAQIGKAFRNEITPRNYIFRSREFEQMEVEYFIPPPYKIKEDATSQAGDGDAGAGGEVGVGGGAGGGADGRADGGADGRGCPADWSLADPEMAPALDMHAAWVVRRKAWLESIGIRGDMLSEDVHSGDSLAHYASACTDICFQFPFGVQELEGVALRGDYDLRCHQEASGKSLMVEHEFTVDAGEGSEGAVTKHKDHVLPYVIEPSLGVDRCFLALIVSSFRIDQVGKDKRTYLSLPPRLAPIKVCILPLVKNKPVIMDYAMNLRSTLQNRLRHCGPIGWDITGAIGRRYRRFDEIGTPFCVTVDFDTVEAAEGEESTVTLRLRDCTTQRRLTVDELVAFLEGEIY